MVQHFLWSKVVGLFVSLNLLHILVNFLYKMCFPVLVFTEFALLSRQFGHFPEFLCIRVSLFGSISVIFPKRPQKSFPILATFGLIRLHSLYRMLADSAKTCQNVDLSGNKRFVVPGRTFYFSRAQTYFI